MIIIRSFDVNKPGTSIDELQGGVVGGSVLEGVLQVGMDVELRPGHMFKDAEDNVQFTPIKSRIVSLQAENNPLLYAVPGGLIAVGLMIDPSITRNDRMVGNVLGIEGSLPDIFVQVDIQFSMLKKSMSTGSDKKPLKITKIVQD
jgi:translation initiation factor 2 subunit 3